MIEHTRLACIAIAVTLGASGCKDKSEPIERTPAQNPQPAQDPQPSQDLETRCQAGDLEGCRQRGVELATGEGGGDAARANGYFERACQGGNGAACSNWAMSFMTGFGVPTDEKRAHELFDKACQLEHLLGCRNLGLSYLEGKAVAPDPAKARRLFGGACAGGVDLACTNFAMALRDGVGGEADVPRAIQVLTGACQGDAAACRHLGAMYAGGHGLVASAKSAALWFGKACDGGDAAGCLALGMMQLESEPELAKKALQAACAGRDERACKILVKKGWATASIKEVGDADAGLEAPPTRPPETP